VIGSSGVDADGAVVIRKRGVLRSFDAMAENAVKLCEAERSELGPGLHELNVNQGCRRVVLGSAQHGNTCSRPIVLIPEAARLSSNAKISCWLLSLIVVRQKHN
jgi:hypothetical protein